MGKKIEKTSEQVDIWLKESMQRVNAHSGNEEYENGYAQALTDLWMFINDMK